MKSKISLYLFFLHVIIFSSCNHYLQPKEEWNLISYSGINIKCPAIFDIDTFDNGGGLSHNIRGTENSNNKLQFCLTWIDADITLEKMQDSYFMSGNIPLEIKDTTFHTHKAKLLKYIHHDRVTTYSNLLISVFDNHCCAFEMCSEEEQQLDAIIFKNLIDSIQFPNEQITKEESLFKF